jgi:predicted acetyltransferase
VSAEQLAEIDAGADAFLVSLSDRWNANPEGRTYIDDDGSRRVQIPRRVRWMWDGEFCGAINLRWQPGTDELPAHVSGHIGYSVVPWKRGHGFATRALRHMIEEAREVGLRAVELTTTPDNHASQRVIVKCGGENLGMRAHPDGQATIVWRITVA